MFGMFIKPLPCMDSLIKTDQILNFPLNRSIDKNCLLSCHLFLSFSKDLTL